MIKYATIGTSWITEQFIEACRQEGSYQLNKVYSRSMDKADRIVQKFGFGQAVDQIEALYDDDIDLIYIASPNSLHYHYAMEAINHGKHVIVEKPQFASLKEWQTAHDLGKEKKVYVFEAIRHIQTKNYKLLKSLFDKKLLDLDYPFLGAAFNIGQYSSRYDTYVQSIEEEESVPNIFSLDFAGGSLMDMGVYLIYVAIDLFGMPERVDYQPLKGPNGIDLMGTIYLDYGQFHVSLFVSKAVHSIKPSEIYLGDETIVIPNITDIDQVDLINRHSQILQSYQYQELYPMYDEAKFFADIILGRQTDYSYEELEELSFKVAEVMEELRKSAGLVFSNE